MFYMVTAVEPLKITLNSNVMWNMKIWFHFQNRAVEKYTLKAILILQHYSSNSCRKNYKMYLTQSKV